MGPPKKEVGLDCCADCGSRIERDDRCTRGCPQDHVDILNRPDEKVLFARYSLTGFSVRGPGRQSEQK